MIHRERLADELMAIAARTWHPRYDGEAREIALFTVARIAAAVNAGRLDCTVSFERVPLCSEWMTNPLREEAVRRGGYPELRRLLSSGGSDSVPISVASFEGRPIVWDGHRRLETYRSAGRGDVPAWHARFERGTGSVQVRPMIPRT